MRAAWTGQWVAWLSLLGAVPLPAQSPDAFLRGVVTDRQGRPLAQVRVSVTNGESGFSAQAVSDQSGQYTLSNLPRGVYRMRAELAGYQAFEQQGVELAVADRRELHWTLIPAADPTAAVQEFLGVVPQSRVLPVETVASTVSVVVDESKILQLPLATRNIFSLFLLQPGVTSQGAILRRGLTFTVHGQRVSGSNYLLDGVDNNDIVITGPVAAASAEAVQEFRMVNSSFSAENGRATAFVAQVVTRAGGNRLHGSVFEFLGNDRLNANTFANNADGAGRPPLRQNQFGYSVQGPLQRNRRFFSSALELSRLHYRTPVDLRLPTASFIAGLPADSLARRLMDEFPPLPSTPSLQDPNVGMGRYLIPDFIDTLLTTQRVDQHSVDGKDRLLLRYTLATTALATSRNADGYPGLQPTDRHSGHNLLLGWTRALAGGSAHELRLGGSRGRVHEPRPRADIPVLQVSSLRLPSNTRQIDRRESNHVLQVSEQWASHRGRSSLRAGFDYRRNLANGTGATEFYNSVGALAVFPHGFFLFPNLPAFGRGQPQAFSLSVDRSSSGRLAFADLNRRYRSQDFAAFLQNDLRLHRRFSLNVGLRWEYFGVLHNVDRSRDVNLYFGPGATIEERLAAATLLRTEDHPGDLRGLLHHRDPWNLAPSIGLAWDPWGRGRTAVRAGYAVALDRVADTLRDPRANTHQVVNCSAPRCTPRFQVPVQTLLPLLPQELGPASVVQVDENLVTPYAQNWYLGVQHAFQPQLLLELGHAGSVGRKLISRDTTNRPVAGRSLSPRFAGVSFFSNAGNSNYVSLEAALRSRFSPGLQYGVSYTYSHAIDNQSDAMEGYRSGAVPIDASFTRQFDARLDRGNSNFDQRHNLVFHAIWELPGVRSQHWPARLLRHWTASAIGAWRTGFPVTLFSSIQRSGDLYNNRVDFLGAASGGAQPTPPAPVPGGVQWVDRSLFGPAVGHVGSLGRGAAPGPGFWNHDFALTRLFRSGESRLRAHFRAEFYNLLNHANLSAPIAIITDPNFGRAYYGRSNTPSRFGELPLDSAARRIQMALRIQF